MDNVRFSLRIPKYLNDWLEEEAKKLTISKNSLIIMYLNDLKKNKREKRR